MMESLLSTYSSSSSSSDEETEQPHNVQLNDNVVVYERTHQEGERPTKRQRALGVCCLERKRESVCVCVCVCCVVSECVL